MTAAEFIEAVVDAARDVADPPAPDGARACRFLCTTPAALLPQKLAAVARQFGLAVEVPEPGVVVLRRPVRPAGAGYPRAGAGGLWASVRQAPDGPETAAAAGLIGEVGGPARQELLRAVPRLLAAVRGALENMREPRAHPRYPAGFPVRLHPVGPDGSVGAAEDGVCEDVSAGGARVLARAGVPEGQVYLEFRGLEGLEGIALLATVVRSTPGPTGHAVACRFQE
jgi:hypothetical protein